MGRILLVVRVSSFDSVVDDSSIEAGEDPIVEAVDDTPDAAESLLLEVADGSSLEEKEG